MSEGCLHLFGKIDKNWRLKKGGKKGKAVTIGIRTKLFVPT
jgi:hypothetical protein